METKAKPYICEHCGKRLESEEEHQAHMHNVHHDEAKKEDRKDE